MNRFKIIRGLVDLELAFCLVSFVEIMSKFRRYIGIQIKTDRRSWQPTLL